MERGTLSVIRQTSQGPCCNLQRRENGRHTSEYIPADQVAVVEANLARRPLARIVTDGIEFARSVAASSGLTVEGFGVESDQFQELLADEFVRQTQAAGFMLPLYKMLTGGVNKQVRIRRLSSYITRKQIRFRNTPGTRLLVRQLQEFPTADHDDGPDSLEYALRLAIRLWNGKQGKR